MLHSLLVFLMLLGKIHLSSCPTVLCRQLSVSNLSLCPSPHLSFYLLSIPVPNCCLSLFLYLSSVPLSISVFICTHAHLSLCRMSSVLICPRCHLSLFLYRSSSVPMPNCPSVSVSTCLLSLFVPICRCVECRLSPFLYLSSSVPVPICPCGELVISLCLFLQYMPPCQSVLSPSLCI